jgi:protein-S-isoprenylcysteine O-methyltransferase Ste14
MTIEALERRSHDAAAPECIAKSWRSDIVLDWASRIAIIVGFSGLAVLNIVYIQQGIVDWQDLDHPSRLLAVAARVGTAMFLALVAVTTLTRLRPVAKAQGIRPRVSALLGTFLCTTLTFLPPADLDPFSATLSTIMVILGTWVAFVVLTWLGPSISIMPEARQLVTTGPYAIVRHPLYVSEALATLGIMVQVFSPLAALIVALQLLLQLQRTKHEEKVLHTAFPEYGEYAARTPWVIPGWRKMPLSLGLSQ